MPTPDSTEPMLDEERSDSPKQTLAAVYDQACAQYERTEKLEALLAAERERVLTGERP